jgi:uncharacterized membrane protein (DUF373 family)
VVAVSADDGAADETIVRPLDRPMAIGEQVIYIGIAALLFVCATIAVLSVGYGMVDQREEGGLAVVTTALDGLLLAFIFVELFGAVRKTLAEQELVAEPFLIVGIIASIKEIIVAALGLADASGEEFDDGVLKVGVLGVVVLLLAISTLLIRRKEREPSESG